ncbi:putative MFS transporter [Aspergillus affinis]|uniref:putative MFS transporter n=1 Tax=Aspergillus affinis TaxID=1070780 RepID=UPI0022FE7078|nr:putative MFS transporter [Aspergillus affinis]KAI9039371.1 putative MFS transporter [Aspergillus affinis]
MLGASFAGLVSPMPTSIYYPALPALAEDMHVLNTLINLTVMTYLIFQGIAPSFTGSLSDAYGRRPAYIICFTIYVGANIGLAPVVVAGFCYLPFGIGSLTSRWTVGFALDWNFKREAKMQGLEIVKNKQQDIREFDIEAARLKVTLPLVYAACLCIIGYGWVMDYQTALAGPLVMLIFTCHLTTGAFTTLSTLVVDVHRHGAATAVAANNLVRCLLGAGAAAVGTPEIDRIGIGWTATLVAGIWAVFSPLLVIMSRWGHEWREEMRVKGEAEMDSGPQFETAFMTHANMALTTKDDNYRANSEKKDDQHTDRNSRSIMQGEICTPEEEKRVLRKIDMVILPMALLCDLVDLPADDSDLDKQSLSYAAVFGLITDLDLEGSQYSWCSSIFYFGRLWITMNGLAQVIGALLMYGIGKNTQLGLAPWRVLFLVCGALTTFSGILFTVLMPNGPQDAWFLNAREKEVLRMRMAADNEGGDARRFSGPQFKEAMLDVKSWLVFGFGLLVTMQSPVLTASCISDVMAILLSLSASNVKGNTKRAVVNSLFFIGYCVGCIAAPQLWTKRPRYFEGVVTAIVTWCLLFVVVGIYWAICAKENKFRDEKERRGEVDAGEAEAEDGDVTDTQDRGFRYSL